MQLPESQSQTEENQQDSKPPSRLFKIIDGLNFEQTPQIFGGFLWKSNQFQVNLKIYNDCICIETAKKTLFLTFSLEVSFSYSLEEKKLWIENKETKAKEEFRTQSIEDLKQLIYIMKTRCAQNNFNSKYELIEEIGKSKNCIVYTARKNEDGQIYAVKILQNSSKAIKQVEILRELHHPNLTFMHQYYIKLDSDETCIVMQYENGGTLLQRISKQSELDYKQKIKFVIDMLNALQFLRIKGIVHRDIKPENILYSLKDGNYKISDFGLAARVGEKVTTISGTPGYMAPQFLQQQKSDFVIDVSSDIYSMGLTFYEIFTGKRYYQELDQTKLLNKNLKSTSFKSKNYEGEDKHQIQKRLLELMIRKKPKNRLNSCQIMQSSAYKKLNRFFNKDHKKSTSSSEATDEYELKQQNFFHAFKKLLKAKNS